MELVVVDPMNPDPGVMARAGALLRAGGLVAFPTETVYGLGANALDAGAVARIFAAKGRPASDPVIVHVLGLADLAGGPGRPELAERVPAAARRLAEAFWPGPLTLVVRRGLAVPDVVTAGLDSVAVRAPAHPVARALLAAAGVPIAAPSANPFGRTSPTTAAHVKSDLGDRIDLLIDGGPADVGVESTIVDCRGRVPVVLRPGGLALEILRLIEPELAWLPPDDRLASAQGDASMPQRAPGQLERHYAPRARLTLWCGSDSEVRRAIVEAALSAAERGESVGLLLADEDLDDLAHLPASILKRTVGSLRDPAGVARQLFVALRDLDGAGVDVILARDFGSAGLALAVRDRLTRAAEGRVIRMA